MRQKWPKELPPLSRDMAAISDGFMRLWHEEISSKKAYGLIERFNHRFPSGGVLKFRRTLEIGAGIGQHYAHEKASGKLTSVQRDNYISVELRQNMADKFRTLHPEANVIVGDCQGRLNFPDGHFDRIIAIHVLEHLPNLPASISEMRRLCSPDGEFSVVIPCEGGMAYSAARRVSSKRLFEKTYSTPYEWFIRREHLNIPSEIIDELETAFTITKRSFFPLVIPSINLNLCIGLRLEPK